MCFGSDDGSCVCLVYCLCVFVCSMNGALAFVDTSDCTMMNIAEHYMASDVEWDPTGRYVVTSVSWWSHKVHATPSNQILTNISTITELALNILYLHFVCVWCRWTMHTGCGHSRAVFSRRTTRTASASCSGDPGHPP